MQAVLDREILEVAQPCVDLAQGLVGRGVAINAGFAREAAPVRGFDDQPCQPLAPLAIKSIGLGIFVDQPFELAHLAGKTVRD